jgi:phosphate transport system substrate-binding protein
MSCVRIFSAASRLRAAWLSLVCAGMALALPAQADEIKIGGTGAGVGTMALLVKAFARERPDLQLSVLPSMGSGGSIKAVLAGAIQIGISARALKEDERRAGAVSLEYARTPFVFAVAASSRVDGITTGQLIEAYAGRASDWPDGSKLRLVLRPTGDSDSDLIRHLAPGMPGALDAAEQRKGMYFAVNDQEAAAAIERIPGALGPTTLALILSEERRLKALALDGVLPNAENLANGRYTHHKALMLVTGPRTPPEAQAFVRFVQSDAARKLLRQTGHWVP